MEDSQATTPSLSSPTEVASTTITRCKIRARKRSSWTEQHIISMKEGDASKRRCNYCHLVWSSSTSTGSIAKHLLDKHNINSTTPPQVSNSVLVQSQIDAPISSLAISRTLEKKFDSSIARFIVSTMLPHAYVESSSLRTLVHDFSPGYQLKSAHTVKRLVLRMYIVLRQLVITYLSSQSFRYAMTYDGCTISSLKGFYPMTLHWISLESGKSISVLLDLLDVFPGDGVGKRVGQALFLRLKSFGISSRLLSTTSNGASESLVASKELARLLLSHHEQDILQPSHMLRCMVHTCELGVKSAIEVITHPTMKLRKTLYSIRTSKVGRAIFKKYSKNMHENGEQEPPCLDCATSWNSTLVMYQQALKFKDVLSYTVSDKAIAHEFEDHTLSIEDWNHIQSMEQWLLVPAVICNYISGLKYPTLSLAALAFKRLLSHCNNYISMDMDSIESPSERITLQVQQEASNKCVQYLIEYQESLNSIPSRITMFLDPRVPKPSNPIERNLDIELVGNVLDLNYHVDNIHASPSGDTSEGHHFTHEEFWKMLGANGKSHESSSSEIEDFLKLPRAKTNIDPLQWWFTNRSSLPRLYKMACEYLAIPASSVPSKEANSEASYNFEDTFHLHSCIFKAEMCIRSWLDLLDSANISIPEDINDAYNSLDIDLEDMVAEDDVMEYLYLDQ